MWGGTFQLPKQQIPARTDRVGRRLQEARPTDSVSKSTLFFDAQKDQQQVNGRPRQLRMT